MKQRATNRRTATGSVSKASTFAGRLATEWKALGLPISGAAVVIAVSGGADSTALLLAVEELIKRKRLQIEVVVAHLDHGLRAESRHDAKWVTQLANKLTFKKVSKRIDVKKRATASGDNLEQAARLVRYEFLSDVAVPNDAAFVLTAHTMDDQAETIMLRLLRGSGADGLAGIEPVRPLKPGSSVQLVRPLLSWARRTDTEKYCRQRAVDYLADPMNVDEQFDRVRVRRQLLPMMESFNSKIVEALVRTGVLLRDELTFLNDEAKTLLAAASQSNKIETNGPALDVRVLAQAPTAIRRRALRYWVAENRGDLRRFELVHIRAIEKLLTGEQGGRVAELPGGTKVVRKRSSIELLVNG
jgi:tRNA(Ile)-lysidine synthase